MNVFSYVGDNTDSKPPDTGKESALLTVDKAKELENKLAKVGYKFLFPPGKHVHAMNTPLNPTFI